MKTKIVVTVGIIAALLIVITAVKFLKTGKEDARGEGSLNPKSKGSPAARVKIEEYSDFQCQNCGWGAEVLKEFIAAHPQEIYLKFNHFPRAAHKYAFKMAVYAECAAKQGKFWQLHDALFREQLKIKKSENPERDLERIAAAVGIDIKKLSGCMNGKESASAVQAEIDKAKARGVRSTPTYFINGKKVVGMLALMDEMGKHFKEAEDEKP